MIAERIDYNTKSLMDVISSNESTGTNMEQIQIGMSNFCNNFILNPKKLFNQLVLPCPNSSYCKEVIAKCDMTTHITERCKGASMPCLYFSSGCKFNGPRASLGKHLQECSFKKDSSVKDTLSQTPILAGNPTSITIYKGLDDLGISFVGGCDTPLVCIFVQEIFKDGVISRDGRLTPGDQIIEVNGINMLQISHNDAKEALSQPYFVYNLTIHRENSDGMKRDGSPNNTSFVEDLNRCVPLIVKTPSDVCVLSPVNHGIYEVKSQKKVKEVKTTPCSMISSLCLQSCMYLSKAAFIPQTIKKHKRKLISFRKEPFETLGISIAGGKGSPRGDVPIYTSNIQNTGCMAYLKLVKKGDILISINGSELIGKTHIDAVLTIKRQVRSSYITLEILEGFETSDEITNFTPSWIYWLYLPRYCQFHKVIIIEKNLDEALGLSIVGGCDCSFGQLPIYVKSVIPGSPAHKCGIIKSGDLVLSVNGHSLERMSHTKAVNILRNENGRILLKVVSWPGTYV